MERTLKVFISCALGAAIGAMISLKVSSYFWWTGMIAGGLIGYLLYEFKTAISAIRATWHGPHTKLGEFFLHLLAYALFLSTAFLPMLVYVYFYRSVLGIKILTMTTPFLYLVCIIISFGFTLGNPNEIKDSNINMIKNIIKLGNPIVFYIYTIPLGIIKGIPLALCGIKKIFILIHSEIRLLCGIDAAIGTAIGYFTGSVIIGAIAGGLFGVLNYEVVSKRILHLVPTKNT